MPIDPMMLDAMLNTFRGMAKEIEDKGLQGEDVDKMNATLARMEQLGQELSDLNEFNGMVMQENLYGTFSDHYGKALSAQAQNSQSEGGYDDSALLKQTLDALKDAVKRIKEGKAQAIATAESYSEEESMKMGLEYLKRNSDQFGNITEAQGFDQKTNEALAEARENDQNDQAKRSELINAEMDALFDEKALIEPIEDLIRLGEEPGMTLPLFLKIQIEKGMDKAMEGSAVTRAGLDYNLDWANAMMLNPYEIQEAKENIRIYDEMASTAPFNIPDSLQLTLADNKVEWELEPKKIYWNELKDRFFNILDHLHSLVIANSQFFPSYSPYTMMATYNEKKEHAEYIKNCLPGIMKEEEKLLEKYFGVSFLDMFKHEIFIWEVENYHIWYSQEYAEFLKNTVYPEVVPLEFLSSETVGRFENEFHGKGNQSNPEAHKHEERVVAMMNAKFGEGYYEKKFGRAEFEQSTAKPWDLNSFN